MLLAILQVSTIIQLYNTKGTRPRGAKKYHVYPMVITFNNKKRYGQHIKDNKKINTCKLNTIF